MLSAKQFSASLEAMPMMGKMRRIVEAQEESATTKITNNFSEQQFIESLIDEHKPRCQSDTDGLHYLLKTPFRYPPLQYGSRFGQTFERGIFYGSSTLDALLHEHAYYRFIFAHRAPDAALSSPWVTQHSVFTSKFHAQAAVTLNGQTAGELLPTIVHPKDYSYSQALGRELRERDCDMIVYPSAREPKGDINYAVFKPGVLKGNAGALVMERWFCQTTRDYVEFKAQGPKGVVARIALSTFLVDGELPDPAG